MSKVVKVSMEPIDSKSGIFEFVVARCNFCQKESGMKEDDYKNIVKLGHGHFYCPFCLRNRFNHKKKGHVLLMDFRGIVGFYLHYLYDEGVIWYAQILDYVRKHSVAGLRNPVFSYDHESMLWFVDFSRIGSDKHKVPIEIVHLTVKDIIDSFDVARNVKSCNPSKILEKYTEAIDEYYKTRKRPEGKRILSPTLKNCAYDANADWDATKVFDITTETESFIPVGYNRKEVLPYTQDLTDSVVIELSVIVKRRKSQGEYIGWEGYTELPGISRTKLSAKDGKTIFEERKSLVQLARKAARKLGLKVKIEGATETESERSAT